ncbi:O-acetyl-ADP-ribose deacetylase [Lactobacillus delbrueckii]|uniref:O-acetyl-ADP-ribose deacetylase n=1 Tax=Lactobacillus delbrueckii TaxID=1584 RepID=UPI001E403066|nr:O-acetyl-ADP-ribose deacetylase [Lactobacillus delbrueckii]MCD5514479.1 O-acetyl-ADP-ribose deacetylase [Lactobacillus delbrueckii subsp. lactis]MCT3501505.1 O-acetyl-ADP-ribose deacetylase [Lactobacillus delbrueckii subsp. lactis]
MNLEIWQGDITTLKVGAIVNAANRELRGGGGVDGAIHQAAGPELNEACRALGSCDTGEAKITPGFNLPSKYIIHTVGPIYSGSHSDPLLLAACYRNSIRVAKENGLHSVAFSAISTGVYGYPLDAASKVAFGEVRKWLREHKDYEMRVIMVAYDARTYALYQKLLG